MRKDNPFEGLELSPTDQAEVMRLIGDAEAIEEAHDIHPIVRHALQICLEDDGETWREDLDESRTKALDEFLDSVKTESPETLGKAVFDLLRVAVFLDHELKVGKPAYRLLNVANDAVVRYDLLSTVEAVENQSERERAKHVAGAGDVKDAPMIGDGRPDGAVDIHSLDFPKRL